MKLHYYLLLILLLLTNSLLFADQSVKTESNKNKLVIAIKEAPPFVIKNSDNSWSGISIELWQQIAQSHEWDYVFEESKLKSLFEGVEKGKFQLGIGALSITHEREKIVDFSQPFYHSGLGIAVSKKSETSIFQILKNFFSADFLKVLTLLVGILLLFGVLIWILERNHNQSQFDKKPIKGIGSGFWWSAVTMTTVGFGDKAPLSFWGRVVAIIWMFTGIIIISSITAAITASLTVNQLNTVVRSAEDLPNFRVATVEHSSSESYLKQNKIHFYTYPDIEAGLQALKANSIDALVYDIPILKYQINTHFSSTLTVLPDMLEQEDYGIVLPTQSPLTEKINREVLKRTRIADWEQLLYRYLGT